jgi:hypothetical protein
MSRIGETFVPGADHFIKQWPKEDATLIREALQRLESTAPKEGVPP